MTAAIQAQALGKRYRGRWALSDCTLSIPAGRVVGLVGPNGAGKSTLLGLVSGQSTPTTGTIRVLGRRPGADREQLARVGFVAQDTPVYADLTVAEHLRFGARMNPGWDAAAARRRIDRLGLDPRRKAGRLSGGQRAQLALALAEAKQPELLLLDEPVAALDPLARHTFLRDLVAFAGERAGRTVVLSSHVITDLERVCDHLVLLSASRVQLAGPCEELLARHRRITGRRAGLPEGATVVHEERTDARSTLVVRTTEPLPAGYPGAEPLGLEELVLAYLAEGARQAGEGLRCCG
ncbi:ABC transporter ATP-binding protein [Kitasatospora sp. NPDC018058]|uniref:ABC transporter ATP-binding protein n=1 Tax=Kitasatospora sp. NPDC018058 TaxID=3364025 RepID=UPI0037C130E3